ncbi:MULTISPECIES: glycosyltransferase [unclassified Streptomyces]|uniref:glycosyltransferase family 2 protein n=1 Tax=unclassified Streptomyces TaxID=2593676 RepID=UPI0033D094D6
MPSGHRRSKRGLHAPWQTWVCVAAAAAATAWTLVYHVLWSTQPWGTALVFYCLITAVLIYSLAAVVKGRSFTHLPAHEARVLAIVPAYNEPPEALYKTVWALINQVRPPDAIHVVDDGSKIPVAPFEHPLVTWHRQDNGGKREAQAHVLRLVDPSTYDLIMTVDSDSVVHRMGLWHCLKAMSDARVQACTGLTLVSNYAHNLLTRVIDVEIVTWCLVTRMARSQVGAVAPTSGILAVYRKELVLDNLDDYVNSGTAGDDRRLTHYALQRGQVVAVNEAWVYSKMPTDLNELFTQRVRWFKSYWRYVGWELTHFSAAPLFFRLYGLVVTATMPILYVWVLFVLPYHTDDKLVFVQGLGYWLIMTYAQTGMYAALRPELTARQKIAAWLFLTPLVTLLNLFIVRPAMYWALTQARTTHWGTRQAGIPAPVAERT